MSKRYKGGVLSATPPTTSTTSATGIWTEQSMFQAVGAGTWPGVPGAPTIGTATAGDASASVTFTAPVNNGGSAITSYTVTSSPGSVTASGASSPITVSGLTNGTAYTFTVRATNATGTGPASAASNSVTPAAPVYIEQVFSTYLYAGADATTAINNGVNLSGNGGMLWLKARNQSTPIVVFDTNRGASPTNSQMLWTASNDFSFPTSTDALNSFNSNGFTLGADDTNWVNTAGINFASWSFAQQTKFFDVVTYTGNGVAGREIAHNLGATPGCMIVKCTSNTEDWKVYHRSLGSDTGNGVMRLNTTAADQGTGYGKYNWGNNTIYIAPTSTVFTVATDGSVNANGQTYVAYLFAHNAGGFGLTGTDNVMSCGSFATGAGGGGTVDLGYEPQWLMVKSATAVSYWYMFDNMRGWTQLGAQAFRADGSVSEFTFGNSSVGCRITATGFTFINGTLPANETWIYMAIRRGPMKVPTVGTSVYNTVGGSGSDPAYVTGFPVDWALRRYPDAAQANKFYSRLVGQAYVNSASPAAEVSDANGEFDYPNAWFSNPDGAGYYSWAWQRAPKFFDVVTYTGNAVSGRQVPHNLTVAPELLIVKGRAYNTWVVAANMTATTYYELYFDSDQAAVTGAPLAYSSGSASFTAAPTSTTFGLGPYDAMNGSGKSYVAYMFATLAGVSKVGTYTGTGAVQTVNCGFTGGARFVMIKRTATAGNWILFDTTRGMVAGSDYYINPNLQDTQSNSNLVYTIATGFQVVSTNAALNATGESFFFLAIA